MAEHEHTKTDGLGEMALSRNPATRNLIDIRRIVTQVEDIFHEGGPRAAAPRCDRGGADQPPTPAATSPTSCR